MMKKILITIILIQSHFCYSQNAPDKIGDYKVGISTATDFKSNIVYKATTISNDDELTIAEVAPDEEYAGNIWTHPVSVDYLTRFPSRKEFLYTNDSTEVFFLNHINMQTYVVNNVFLYFFQDTLVKITYDGSKKVNSLILEKYKGNAFAVKKTESKSECHSKTKSGKAIKDLKIAATFLDERVISTVELNLISDDECNLSEFVSVEISDKIKLDRFIKCCTDFIIKKGKIHMEYLKEVSEKEKSKL